MEQDKRRKKGKEHHFYKSIEIPCAECGDILIRNPSRIKMYKNHFCNQTCSSNYKKRFKAEKHYLYAKVEVNCTNCNTVILVSPYKFNKNKMHYCNKDCMFEHRNKIGFYKGKNNSNYKGENASFNCAYCGKEAKLKCKALLKACNNHFCSKECYKKFASQRTGDKAYNWRGGKGTLLMNIRHLSNAKEWTLSVFKRDNYICTVCNKSSNKLNAHHLEQFVRIIRKHNITTIEDAQNCVELWDIDNGVTLCKPCHDDFHRLYGKNKFTKEDYYKFKNEKIM